MPFKKGQSGNPGGQWAKKDWAEQLRIVGNEKTPEGKRKLRALAEKVFDAAMAGDMDAVREIANRRDGRPKAEGELNVNFGLSDRFLAAVRAAANPVLRDGGRVIDVVPERSNGDRTPSDDA